MLLEEIPSNAESTTLVLLELQLPMLVFTAHTLEPQVVEFVVPLLPLVKLELLVVHPLDLLLPLLPQLFSLELWLPLLCKDLLIIDRS